MDEKRTFGTFRIGTVTLVDNSVPGTQRHQVVHSPLELRDGVPAVTPYGFYTWPHLGSQALALHAAGDQSKGVVIAVHDQRYRMTMGAEGEVAIADDLGQTVHLTRQGIVISGAGLPVTIQNTPTVMVQADLHVTGAVIAGYGGADQVTLQSHQHADAGGTGESGVPVPM